MTGGGFEFLGNSRRVMNSDGIGLPLFRTVLLWIVCCNVFLRVFF